MLRHIPNAITVIRILLVVPIGAAILSGHSDLALLLAAIAGASDALDGFLARHFSWQTRLGAWLDPAADKLMLAVAFICLSVVGATPWWLTMLVLARDVVIVVGVLAIQRWRGPVTVAPSHLSKGNTLAQIVYVLAALLGLHGTLELSLQLMVWLVAVLTVLSGIDYVVRYAARSRRNIE